VARSFLEVRRNDHACWLSDRLHVVLKARCGSVEIEVNLSLLELLIDYSPVTVAARSTA
jgi:hypothetical protein